MKKTCETFFQKALRGDEGKEVGSETVESLSIKFGMILEYLKEIKGVLGELPCDDLGRAVAENTFEIKYLKEQLAEVKKELNEEIYTRLRAVEGKTIKLTEQNVGQNDWSGKMWALIVLGINSAFMIAIYFMTRGVS
ncbi:hypothetical protein KAR91_27850 [Candidatus Pacearchaeota archaeon]|nr:hypothetical protein [Candidatus Pacearchaeota archaeon]